MKIAVIGTGYVGLVSGACFADKGFDVYCVDIDKTKIDMLNGGEVPIYEPGLKDIIDTAVRRKHITFTTDMDKSILESDAVFICVGTPEGANGRPDLSAVHVVAKSIGAILKNNPSHKFKVVVDKSTVPVGTGDVVEKLISDEGATNFAVASNPEFLKEGAAIDDFMKPDRVVIGTDDEQAKAILLDIYSAFVVKTNRILIMDRRSAEMTKYVANSMLALRITFMNQIANLCEKVGADVVNVRKGIGSDSRIGPSFLFPGPGYGGSCFPKDVKALIHLGNDNNSNVTIMESVDDANQKQKIVLANKIKDYFGTDLKSKKIAVWGLSFKPETDDIRESPAIYLIDKLIDAGAEVSVYDPEALENFKNEISHENISHAESMYAALTDCDALAVVTDWNEFRRPDFEKAKSLMKSAVIFDGRNLYSHETMRSKGFEYEGIGRKI